MAYAFQFIAKNNKNAMTKTMINELKELDKLANRIAKKKQRIEARLQVEKETAKWYDQVLKESEFKRPRDFIKALMEHFGIRTISLSKGKRGPGRPAKAAGPAKPKTKSGANGRRKRTKMTPELRDKVKAALAKGTSKNAASKNFGVSNLVVKKVEQGAYDSL
jgi:hypothetical protein